MALLVSRAIIFDMKNSECLVCGKPLVVQRGRGHPRWYCSPTCRNRADYARRQRLVELGRKVVQGEGVPNR